MVSERRRDSQFPSPFGLATNTVAHPVRCTRSHFLNSRHLHFARPLSGTSGGGETISRMFVHFIAQPGERETWGRREIVNGHWGSTTAAGSSVMRRGNKTCGWSECVCVALAFSAGGGCAKDMGMYLDARATRRSSPKHTWLIKNLMAVPLIAQFGTSRVSWFF